MTKITRLSVAAIAITGATHTFAQLNFGDGMVHLVDFEVMELDGDNWIEVFDSPGPDGDPTHVIFDTGAQVPGTSPFDESVFVTDFSSIEIFDGLFFQDVTVGGGALGEIYGGDFVDDVIAEFFGTIYFEGGTVFDDVEAINAGQIFILDGEFRSDIEAYEDGFVGIAGGQIGIGSSFDIGLGAFDGGFIELVGTDFQIDGMSVVGSGLITETSGVLSGTLLDGTPFSIDFLRDEIGSGILGDINLIIVPEPGHYALIFGGALALLFVGRRSRTKR